MKTNEAAVVQRQPAARGEPLSPRSLRLRHAATAAGPGQVTSTAPCEGVLAILSAGQT